LAICAATPLACPMGGIATKYDLKPEDPQEKFDEASGYIMATGAHAAKLIERLAMRSDDAPPVVIVHQNLKEDDAKKMNDTLKDCEFDINNRRHGDPRFLIC
jgi:hypothetical protein